MNAEFWFVDADNNQSGPVTRDDIAKMIRAGSLGRDSPIWFTGMQDWKAAGQVQEFQPLFGAARPPARAAASNATRSVHPPVWQDKRAIIAVLIFAASFLPFGGGTGTSSIWGIHGAVTALNQALSLLAPPGLPGRYAGNASSIGDIAAALNILLALYLVPLSAIVVVFFALTTGRSRLSAFFNGFISVLLPIGIPLVVGAIVMASLPKELKAMFAQGGGGFDLNSLGLGFWAVILLGGLQLFFSFRRQ